VWFPSRQSRRGQETRHLEQGFRHLAQTKYADAQRAFNEAVLLSPERTDAMLGLGWSLFALGDYGYAAYCLRRAVSKENAPQNMRVDLPSLFWSPAEFTRLVRRLERVEQSTPQDVDAACVLAVVCHFSGKQAEARGLFRRVLEIVPSDRCAQFFLVKRGKTAEQTADRKPRPFPAPRRLGLMVTHSRPNPKAALLGPE